MQIACHLKMYGVSFEVPFMTKQSENHFTSQIISKRQVLFFSSFFFSQYTEVDEQTNNSECYSSAYLQNWHDHFSGKVSCSWELFNVVIVLSPMKNCINSLRRTLLYSMKSHITCNLNPIQNVFKYVEHSAIT